MNLAKIKPKPRVFSKKSNLKKCIASKIQNKKIGSSENSPKLKNIHLRNMVYFEASSSIFFCFVLIKTLSVSIIETNRID